MNANWQLVTSDHKTDTYVGIYLQQNGSNAEYTLSATTTASNYSAINQGNNNIKVVSWIWGSSNGNSWWKITEAETAYNIYDIVVTGLDDASNVNVSTNGVTPVGATSLHNGEAFFFNSSVTPTASNFTATAVAGYDYEVTVADGAVTVAYEVSTTPVQYTVVVTGDPTGTGGIILTNGDVQKLNNETFEFTGIPALTTDYTVIPVAGYTYTTEVSGTNVNVAYEVEKFNLAFFNFTDVASASQTSADGKYSVSVVATNNDLRAGTTSRAVASSDLTAANTNVGTTDFTQSAAQSWIGSTKASGRNLTITLGGLVEGKSYNVSFFTGLDFEGAGTWNNVTCSNTVGSSAPALGAQGIQVQAGQNVTVYNMTGAIADANGEIILSINCAGSHSAVINCLGIYGEQTPDPEEETYTVYTTPASVGGIHLTAENKDVQNEGTFQFTGKPKLGTDFTVLEVENYIGTATVSGTTVTVSYEDISAYAKTVSDITEGWYQIQVGEGAGVNNYHSDALGKVMQGQSIQVTGSNSADYAMYLVDLAEATNNSYIYVTNNEGVVTLRTLDGYFMQANGKRTTSSADINVTQPDGTTTSHFMLQGGGQYTCTWKWTAYGVGSSSAAATAGTARWRFIHVGDEVANDYDIYTVEWVRAEGTLTSSNGRVIFNNKVVLQEKGVDLTADGFSGSNIDGYDVPVVTIDVENKKIVVTYNEPTQTTYYVHTTPENVGGAYLATATETVYKNGESFKYIGTPVAGTNVLAQEVNGYTSTIEVVGTDVNVTYTSVREELLDLINMLKTNYADNNVGKIGYYSEEGSATLYTNVINPALEVYNDENATTADIQSAQNQLTTVIMSGMLISDSYIQKPTAGTLIKIQAPSGNYVLGNGERSNAAPIGAEDGANAVWYYSNATTLIGYNNGIGISFAKFVAEPTEELNTFTFVCAGELGKLYVKTSYTLGSNNYYWKEDGTSLNRTTGTDKSMFVITAVELPASAPITTAGWATAIVPFDATVSDNVTAYKVAVDGESLLKTELTNVIPAGTGVLLKSNGGDATTATFTYSTEEQDDVTGNLLVGNPTSSDLELNESGYLYYKLCYGTVDEESVLGFFWGETDGTSITCPAYKAMLKVEASAGIKGFTLDDETGVASLRAAGSGQSTAAYNLAGQRVNAGYRGIVIENGKKVLK